MQTKFSEDTNPGKQLLAANETNNALNLGSMNAQATISCEKQQTASFFFNE